jgi:site-specific DNA-methyltransferase (adenine-specific)
MVDIKFIHGDCLEEMPKLADKSIDMILCDLPYGTTACKWDVVIPFEPLWAQYKRLIKDNGAIVLTASQPFTSALVMSNPGWFRYEWIWEKTNAVDFALAKKRARKMHENILIFARGNHLYNPQMQAGTPYIDKPRKRTNNIHASTMPKLGIVNTGTRYPSSVVKISNGNNHIEHPTQKPVALFEYLIRTYTNEGDTVLDNCSGSGTTGIAAFNTKRNAILIEKDEQYFNAAKERFYRETRQVAMW